MKVKDLLEVIPEPFVSSGDKVLRSPLIAYDSMDGRTLFNTDINKENFVKEFFEGEVLCIWASAKLRKGTFADSFVPVMCCYVTHDSWKENNGE